MTNGNHNVIITDYNLDLCIVLKTEVRVGTTNPS